MVAGQVIDVEPDQRALDDGQFTVVVDPCGTLLQLGVQPPGGGTVTFKIDKADPQNPNWSSWPSETASNADPALLRPRASRTPQPRDSDATGAPEPP